MDEELDLLDLFFTFWKRRFWLIAALMIGAIAGFLYTSFIVTPEYRSSVTMILAKASNGNLESTSTYDETITQSDISLNQKLIATYGEIMKSRRVGNAVIENLNLDMSYNQLKSGISVTSVKDTDVIKLTITTGDPALSAKIAQEMTKVFTSEVDRIYNIKNISIIDNPEIDTNPVNISYGKNIIIFAIIAFAFVAVIIFLIYYFDNTVKSEENIQKITGLPVLCTIPKMEQEKGGKKRA